MPKKIRKAVIPVAGFGTRFLPASKAQPKEMLTLVDKPVIQYIVEEAASAGIEEIIFITSQNKRAIEDHFDRNFELEYRLKQKKKEDALYEVMQISDLAKFVYVRQNTPLGLGHAVLCAKEVVGDEPFIVSSGDDVITSSEPAIGQMIRVYEKYEGTVLGVKKVPKEKTNLYGIVDPLPIEDRVSEVKGFVEKPEPDEAPSDLAVQGRWLLTPDIFEILENTPKDKCGEVQITDAIRKQMERSKVYAYEYEGRYYDCGNKLEFIKAVIDFGSEHPEIGQGVREYIKSKKGL